MACLSNSLVHNIAISFACLSWLSNSSSIFLFHISDSKTKVRSISLVFGTNKDITGTKLETSGVVVAFVARFGLLSCLFVKG